MPIELNATRHKKKLEKKRKYRIHSFKQNNKINTKSIYYGPISIKLDATRHKGKLFQKNKNYRMRNKLCLYYGKPGH